MKKYFLLILGAFCISGIQAQLMVQAHAGPDTTICAGDSVVIGDNPISSNTTPPLTITWTPNTNISNPTIANPKVAPSATTWYYLTVSDANGRSGTDSILITVHSPSPVSLSPFPNTCFLNSAMILSQGSPTGGYYLGSGINDSITFVPLVAGIGLHTITYFVKDEICQSIDSASQSIQVFPSPSVNATLFEDTLCIGDTTSAVVSGSGLSYTWFPNYNLNVGPNGDSVSLWPDSTIIYRVTGIDSNNCSDSAEFTITVIDCSTGFSENNQESNITIFPNPVKDHLHILIPENTPATYILYDNLGKIVLNRKTFKGKCDIDVSSLKHGTYILEILNSESKTVVRKKILKVSY